MQISLENIVATFPMYDCGGKFLRTVNMELTNTNVCLSGGQGKWQQKHYHHAPECITDQLVYCSKWIIHIHLCISSVCYYLLQWFILSLVLVFWVYDIIFNPVDA